MDWGGVRSQNEVKDFTFFLFFFFLNLERFTNLHVILAQGPC